jgi:hypothetical protein
LKSIAAFSGEVFPVYDTGVILGHAPATGRWLLVDATGAVALSFTRFEAQFRAAPERVLAATSDHRAESLYCETVQLDGEARLVIDIPALIAKLKDHAGRVAKQVE